MVALLMRVLGVPKLAAWLISLGLIGAVLGGAGWWHGREVAAVRAAGKAEGVTEERTSWQAARAELLRLRAEAVDRRDDKLAGTLARIRAGQERASDDLAKMLAARPAGDAGAVCFDDELVRAIEANRAAIRSAAAAEARGGGVPE